MLHLFAFETNFLPAIRKSERNRIVLDTASSALTCSQVLHRSRKKNTNQNVIAAILFFIATSAQANNQFVSTIHARKQVRTRRQIELLTKNLSGKHWT